jgi:hypothetical protein
MTDRNRISTSDGKYTLVQPEHGMIYLLRYGELWSDPGESIRYGNMMFSLALELRIAREELKELKRKYSCLTNQKP